MTDNRSAIPHQNFMQCGSADGLKNVVDQRLTKLKYPESLMDVPNLAARQALGWDGPPTRCVLMRFEQGGRWRGCLYRTCSNGDLPCESVVDNEASVGGGRVAERLSFNLTSSEVKHELVRASQIWSDADRCVRGYVGLDLPTGRCSCCD